MGQALIEAARSLAREWGELAGGPAVYFLLLLWQLAAAFPLQHSPVLYSTGSLAC